MQKPKVFKIAGTWVWLCPHHEAEALSGDFPVSAWRNPWDACLSAALNHAVRCHADDSQVIEP